jgi:hypothetical protein
MKWCSADADMPSDWGLVDALILIFLGLCFGVDNGFLGTGS